MFTAAIISIKKKYFSMLFFKKILFIFIYLTVLGL